MCAHYQAVNDPQCLQRYFDVAPLIETGRADVWPGYLSVFIRRPKEGGSGDETPAQREAMLGSFGMIAHWAKDATVARHTYNARTETVAEKPSFREAWRLGRRCIIPAEAFFEPDWRTGKAVATRIASADGQPLGIAEYRLLESLPENLKTSLPSIEQTERELAGDETPNPDAAP